MKQTHRYEYQRLAQARNMDESPVIEAVEFGSSNLAFLCRSIKKTRTRGGRHRVYDTHSGESITVETAINIAENNAEVSEFVEWGDIPAEFVKAA